MAPVPRRCSPPNPVEDNGTSRMAQMTQERSKSDDQLMTDPKWILAIGLTAALVAACGPTASETTTLSTSTLMPDTTTRSRPSTTATTSSDEEPLAAYEEALARTLAADSYRFDAEVELETASGRARVEMRGWVDGADRELVVRSGDREIRTVVVDGVATVYGSDGPTETPLSEAGKAPSLTVLQELQEIDVAGPGEVSGILEAGLLQRLGINNEAENAPAQATVFFTPGAMIDRYLLRDPTGNWQMRVSLFDVGAVDSS